MAEKLFRTGTKGKDNRELKRLQRKYEAGALTGPETVRRNQLINNR